MSGIRALIVAMDEKRGIGKDGVLPWNIPEDLKRFRELTKDSFCIMGRKTFQEIADRFGYNKDFTPGKRFLPFRASFVVTSDRSLIKLPDNSHKFFMKEEFPREGLVTTAVSVEEALYRARLSNPDKNTFFIGGSSIFNEAIKCVDVAYITHVVGDYDCDTFFPEMDNGTDLPIIWKSPSEPTPTHTFVDYTFIRSLS